MQLFRPSWRRRNRQQIAGSCRICSAGNRLSSVDAAGLRHPVGDRAGLPLLRPAAPTSRKVAEETTLRWTRALGCPRRAGGTGSPDRPLVGLPEEEYLLAIIMTGCAAAIVGARHADYCCDGD